MGVSNTLRDGACGRRSEVTQPSETHHVSDDGASATMRKRLFRMTKTSFAVHTQWRDCRSLSVCLSYNNNNGNTKFLTLCTYFCCWMALLAPLCAAFLPSWGVRLIGTVRVVRSKMVEKNFIAEMNRSRRADSDCPIRFESFDLF